MVSLNACFRTTASFTVIAIAGLSAPAIAAQAQTPVTSDEVEACAKLPTQQERDLCLQGQAQTDSGIEKSGEASTIPPAEAAERQADSNTIVVTGSRIRRNEFTSPDPVQIINPDLAEKEGRVDTGEIIQSSPIAAGSFQITDAISSNFVTNGGPGAQTVSLRGLGAERTLVLLNGRRAGPAGTRGAISSFDLNVLPSSIINSVEILKTGASSVYGSDAIAGVVNVLTKRSTRGIELQGFASVPFESGGETYSTSATYGRDFGRGHFLVSANYFKREMVQRRDRDFFECTEEYLFGPDGERRDITDPRTGKPVCFNTYGPVVQVFGGIAGGGDLQFNDPGDRLEEFLPATYTRLGGFTAPPGFYRVGTFNPTAYGLRNSDSPFIGDDSIIPETERLTFYGDGSFEVSPSVELFTELLYNNRKTADTGSRQFFPLQFAFDPVNVGFSGPFFIRPIVIVDSDSETEVDYYRGVLGARGDFGSLLNGWKWDIYGQRSISDGSYTRDVIFADSAATLERRTAPCAPGAVTAVRGVPCMNINLTDPRLLNGQFTDAERDYLFGEDTGNTKYKQATVEATTTGSPFALPAGDVGVALGVQWRRDDIKDVPGPTTLANNLWGSTAAGITEGRTTTKEVFGEIEIPLIHNTPLIQNLTFNAAGRYTKVNAERNDGVKDSFSDKTYKLGLNWTANDWLRFRGTYGTSFRAPALYEMFLSNQTGFLSQLSVDPCIRWGERLELGQITQRLADNCAAAGVQPDYLGGGSSATIITGGGIGVLEPETSTAKTASVIFTPRRGLWDGMQYSLAVDYFDIEVEGEIATLSAASIVSGCYLSETYPNDPLCSLFTRVSDATSTSPRIGEVRASYLNINRQRNRGVDLTARVSQELGRWGSLNLLGQMTWQIDDEFQLFEDGGELTDDTGEVGEPRYVADFNATWRNNPWIVTYGMDVIGGVSNRKDYLESRTECFSSPLRGGEICPIVSADATFYHSLSVTRLIDDKFEFTLGMSNIFDTPPPRFSAAFSGIAVTGAVPTFGTQYDYLGRRAFINVKARF